MLGVRKQLLQAQHDLEIRCEPLEALLDRMLREGKSMSEIEQVVLELTRIQGAYDSVHMALKMLE